MTLKAFERIELVLFTPVFAPAETCSDSRPSVWTCKWKNEWKETAMTNTNWSQLIEGHEVTYLRADLAAVVSDLFVDPLHLGFGFCERHAVP